MILNLTLIKPTAQTYMTVYPTGTQIPNVVSVGSPASATSGNYNASAAVAIGRDGKVSIFNRATVNVDVVVDVEGYTSAGVGTPSHGGWQPLFGDPVVIDTRIGTGVAKAKVPANGSLSVLVATGAAVTNSAKVKAAQSATRPSPSSAPTEAAGRTATGAQPMIPIGPPVTKPPPPSVLPHPAVYYAVPLGTAAVFGEVTVANSTTNGTLTMRTTDETDPLTGSVGFQSGGTSTGMVIRLGSDGRAVFINHSSAPVDISLSIPGFWATDHTGYTLTPYQNRTSAGQTVAGSGTFFVPSDLVNDAPSNNIQAVLVKVTVAGQTSTGGFTVNQGDHYTGTVLYTTPGQTHSSLMVVGRDGVTIKNLQSTSMRISVDVEGYFADWDFGLDPTPNTRPTAVQASSSNGLDAAYVTATGVLRHGYTKSPDDSSPTWETVTSTPAPVASSVGLSVAKDGVSEWLTLQSTTDGEIWIASVPIGASWNTAVFTRTGESNSSPPAIATLPTDGEPVIFVSDEQCDLFAFYKGDWNQISYKPIPVVVDGVQRSSATTGECSVTEPPRVFADGTGIWVVTPDDNAVGHFTGAVGTILTWPVAGQDDGGRPWSAAFGTKIVAARTTADSSIETNQQSSDGTSFSTWTPAAPLPAGTPTLVGAPSLVYDRISHRFVIIVRSSGGGLLENVESGVGSGAFTNPWTQLGNPVAATDIGMTSLSGSTINGWAGLYIGLDGSEYQIRPAS